MATLRGIIKSFSDFVDGIFKGIRDAAGKIGDAIDAVNPFQAPPPAARTSRAVAGPWSRSARSAGGGGGGGPTINVYTTGDTMEAEQAIVRALRRQARLNGGVVPALGWTS